MTALWAALVLALLMSLVVKSGRTDARIARTTMQRAELDAIAQGAIALTELRLLDAGSVPSSQLDGSPSTLTYARHRIQVSVQGQAGLIDLNFAAGDILQRLFRVATGMDDMTAQTLTDRVLDWREKGAGRRLNGAKAADYAEAGYAYGPREGPFESVAELKLVMGVTSAIFDKVAPALTVYAQKPVVEPDLTPELVLASLPGMTPESAAMQITQRERGEQNGIVGSPTLFLAGRSLRITATIVGMNGLSVSDAAVIRYTGFQTTPFWVYR